MYVLNHPKSKVLKVNSLCGAGNAYGFPRDQRRDLRWSLPERGAESQQERRERCPGQRLDVFGTEENSTGVTGMAPRCRPKGLGDKVPSWFPRRAVAAHWLGET